MSEDVNTGAKIAVSICVICFIISIGMLIMLIGRHFWHQTEASVERPLSSMNDADLSFLSAYEHPAPVAALWKCVQNIGVGNVVELKLKKLNYAGSVTTIGTYHNQDQILQVLKENLTKKAYYSWDPYTYAATDYTHRNPIRDGMYRLEVTLAL